MLRMGCAAGFRLLILLLPDCICIRILNTVYIDLYPDDDIVIVRATVQASAYVRSFCVALHKDMFWN